MKAPPGTRFKVGPTLCLLCFHEDWHHKDCLSLKAEVTRFEITKVDPITGKVTMKRVE